MATALLSQPAHALSHTAAGYGPSACRKVRSSSPVLLTSTSPLAARCRARSQFENRRVAPALDITLPHTQVLCWAAAVLRDISGGTSHKVVRLVFRPYTQVLRWICTSQPRSTSTPVSRGFAPPTHSSPPFGSHAHDSLRSASLLAMNALGSPRTCTPWPVLQDGTVSDGAVSHPRCQRGAFARATVRYRSPRHI